MAGPWGRGCRRREKRGGPSRGRLGGEVPDEASLPDALMCLLFTGGREGAVILHLWEEFISLTNTD